MERRTDGPTDTVLRILMIEMRSASRWHLKSFKSKLMSFLLTTIADDFYTNILRHHHIEVGKYSQRKIKDA